MARETHTPTPWGHTNFTIHTVSPVGSLTIGRVWDDTVTDAVDSPKQALANAALIVAAVNERAAVIAERDRLRAALHHVAFEPIGPPDASATYVLQGCVDIARAALALGEETKP